MTLETYIRPYVQSARFSGFGELKQERTFDFDFYGVDEGKLNNLGAGLYEVVWGMKNPHPLDFIDLILFIQPSKVMQFAGNIALSTLFFVWQQRDGAEMD